MQGDERTHRFKAIEDRFAGYEVYDPNGEKIGRVDDLFVDEADNLEYIGTRMGFIGMSHTLISWDVVSNVDEEGRRIELPVDKQRAKDGPTFDDDSDITPEFENEVYSYYGLQRETIEEAPPRSYDAYYSDTDREVTGPTDEDEVRIQRSEEELRAGTREREAGHLRVRKRVRTDREQVEVPTRREEVSVERVSVEDEAATSGAEIGEEEIQVPVTEEEVVVEKRPVVKEEIRIRKDVVENTEVVEDEVRREEIEVEDESTTRRTDQ